ncbi:MAG: pitrilysin family protein [Patescibacteria group bacterium]|jgi:predicted Zn-dependent peptidase
MDKIKVSRLKNKLPLLVIPMLGTKTVTVLVVVKTGSKYEKKSESGLSHFVEHIFFKGTIRRPDTLALASELDALGGEYNAFTSKEYTGYFVKAEAHKLPEALDIISDMLINSCFSAEEIEREKGVIIEEINMYEDNPMAQIEDIFEELLYGDTPAGRFTIGTKENVNSFKRGDFMKYLKTQYGINSTFVVVAGNISFPEVAKEANKAFCNYPDNKFRPKVKLVEKQKAPALKIKIKPTDQSHLCLGVRTFPSGHKDEFVAKILAVILGGSMSSRLFIELRERRGLAYYIKTHNEYYTDSGYLVTQAGVPKDKLEESVQVIMSEYSRIINEEVTAVELKRAKDMYTGRLAIQLEASDDVANWYASQAIMKKELISPDQFLKKIKAITVSDIKRVAKNIFISKNLNLAVVGPLASEKKLKAILKF